MKLRRRKPTLHFIDYLNIPEDLTQCWEWTGAVDKSGYGMIRVGKKVLLAHRLSFYLANLDWPAELCHSCHNRLCCNPSHLSPCTHEENMRQLSDHHRVKQSRNVDDT